jgi:hypothetical protein
MSEDPVEICMQCHQRTERLATTTDDCRCRVCEDCGLDNMENYRCGVCGAELTAMSDE